METGNQVVGMLFVGVAFGFGTGFATGFAIAINGEIKHIMELLRQFKSEGKDNKWLK